MGAILNDSFDYLAELGGYNLAHLLWFALVFEFPRYMCSALSALLFLPPGRKEDAASVRKIGRISVVIAGYNEESAIEHCVRSLHEQSLVPDEIVVVSDGSVDAMRAKLRALLREGLIHGAHNTDLRAGKSAATNLAERMSDCDILVNVDCDTTFDRNAIRNIVRPFTDPAIGAVSGNILVRNARASLVASMQAIEYLISISMGKRSLAMLDQVACASGAFSAFRRTALKQVGGLDAGSGEDLDLTLRMRNAGFGIAFASDAIAYTDVPGNFLALVRQRRRWERDAIRLRYRTHGDVLNPFSRRFKPAELFHELEFLFFNVLGAIALPAYLLWLTTTYGDIAPVILSAALCCAMVFDMAIMAIAGLAMPETPTLRLFLFLPFYSLFNGVIMRTLRLYAYGEEWVFSMSRTDEYVPGKVRAAKE